VLARAALEKFGGDSLGETRANIDTYLRAVRTRGALQQEAEREPATQPAQASG
jgi:chorismate synthase